MVNTFTFICDTYEIKCYLVVTPEDGDGEIYVPTYSYSGNWIQELQSSRNKNKIVINRAIRRIISR